MLEPCDAKVSCTVLRGLGDRKVARLLGSLHASVSSTVCQRTVKLDYFRNGRQFTGTRTNSSWMSAVDNG